MNLEYIFEDIESCEPVDMDDEWVYDIEVEQDPNLDEDLHTFIANDILIHNSLFFSFKPIIDSCEWEGNDMDFVFNAYEKFIMKYNEKILNEYAQDFGVKNIQDFELEKYSETAIFLAKKQYIAHVLWEDGIKHPRLEYIYPKGIEVVKNSTPPFVREKIMEVITYILDKAKKPSILELTRKVKEIKKLFEDNASPGSIENISMSVSCNNYKKYVIDDQANFLVGSGCPIGVRAAAYHNYLINQNPKLKTKYNLVTSGEKIKYYYTKDPITNIFGYIRNSFPVEIAPEIDIDEQFNKTFLSILNRFNVALDLPDYNKRLTMVFNLFDNL